MDKSRILFAYHNNSVNREIETVKKSNRERRKTMPLFRKISIIILCILCVLQIVFSNQGKTGITAILSIVSLCCMIGSDVIYSNKKKKEQYRKEFDEKYRKGENYLDRD